MKSEWFQQSFSRYNNKYKISKNMQKGNYQQLLKVGTTVVAALKDLVNNPGWEKTGDKPCDVFKMGIDNLMASKGVATVNFPIQQVINFLDTVGSLLLLDDTCIEEKSFYKEKDVEVVYYRFKTPWPVSHRDFVCVSYRLNEGNRVYLGSKSCNYPFAELEGVVRAEAYIGGYILEKIDEKSTKVTYMSNADIKGSIPTLIKNQLSKNQGTIVGRVEQAMKKAKQ